MLNHQTAKTLRELKLYGMADALEQHHPKPLLPPRDRARHRRQGDVELACRGGDVLALGNGDEQAEQVESHAIDLAASFCRGERNHRKVMLDRTVREA